MCDLPHLRVELVEAAISKHYATLKLSPRFVDEAQDLLKRALSDSQRGTRERHAGLAKKLKQLDIKENRLIDLATDGDMPRDKIRSKLHELKVERVRVEAGLATSDEHLQIGAAVLHESLDLVRSPKSMYDNGADSVRRLLNDTFYERFLIDDKQVVSSQLAPAFDELHQASLAFATAGSPSARDIWTNEEAPSDAEGSSDTETDLLTLRNVFKDVVSSKAVMVGS